MLIEGIHYRKGTSCPFTVLRFLPVTTVFGVKISQGGRDVGLVNPRIEALNTINLVSEVLNIQPTNSRGHDLTVNIAALPVQTDGRADYNGMFPSRRRHQWILNLINTNSEYEFAFPSCIIFSFFVVNELLNSLPMIIVRQPTFLLIEKFILQPKLHQKSAADRIFGLTMCSMNQKQLA